jgi:CRISPR-associated protein Cas6/Cse3/CasE subtype I-E
LSLYLSRFLFEKSPEGLELLENVHALHAVVRSMGGGERYLYRVETVRGTPALLVQTLADPDLTGLPEEALRLVGVKRLDPSSLREGAVYRFFVQANFIEQIKGRATRLLSLDEAVQRARRAIRGAEVVAVQAHRLRPLKVRRPGVKPFSIDVVEFRGVLTVRDREALFEVLSRGIGRARGYGLGLLSLAPLG